MSNIESPPLQDSLTAVDSSSPRPNFISRTWAIWLQNSLVPRVQDGGQIIKSQTLIGQSAAIPLTPIPMGTLADGLYRVSLYARITTAASVSSSLTPTLTWTDGGVPQTGSGAPLTGNTTATSGGFVVLIHSDANAPISYSTAYTSVGTTMTYRLDIIVEAL
jgi:hypothetical protein